MCISDNIFMLRNVTDILKIDDCSIAQAEEAKDLSKLMMSKKTQRLFGRM